MSISSVFDWELRDRKENRADGNLFGLIGFFQNKQPFNRYVFTIAYGVVFVMSFNHTLTNFGKADIAFNRVFRSVHAVPETVVSRHAAGSGYWTFDWLTHPLREIDGLTGETSIHSMDVNSATCIDNIDLCFNGKWDGVVDEAECAKKRFSCALTRDQTRYAPGPDNNVCAKYLTKYERTACQMQRTAQMSVVVNDDKSFSISSGHSQPLLLMYVSAIMFSLNFLMLLETSSFRRILSTFSSSIMTPDGVFTTKKAYMIISFIFLLIHRFWYAMRVDEIGVNVPMPNGTFFYGLLSYLAATWFACCHCSGVETLIPGNAVKPAAEESESKTLLTNSEGAMDLNVAGFGGKKKIQMDAFLQPGKGKYQDAVEVDTDLAVARTLRANDYLVEPCSSVWALANLWVWPLLALSAFVVQGNYKLDIDVTVVAVGVFVYGLIDLFVRRLLELKYLYKTIQRNSRQTSINPNATNPMDVILQGTNARDYSMDYGVPLVVIVSMFIQLCVLYTVLWTAEWSFWPTNKHADSGIHTPGDPEKSFRTYYVWTFKCIWIFYLVVMQLYKLMCLVPDKVKKTDAEGKKQTTNSYGGSSWYQNYDGVGVTFLNFFVVVLLCIYLQQSVENNPAHQAFYDTGIYLREVAREIFA